MLDAAQPGDWALLQNETNGAEAFVEAARGLGLKLAYSAAPFDASVTAGLLPHTDLLIVNEGEAAALGEMLGRPPEESGVPHLVITRGGEGADYHGEAGHIHQPAFAVTPVDTTGAGDCFFGYFLAGMARGDAIDRRFALPPPPPPFRSRNMARRRQSRHAMPSTRFSRRIPDFEVIHGAEDHHRHGSGN